MGLFGGGGSSFPSVKRINIFDLDFKGLGLFIPSANADPMLVPVCLVKPTRRAVSSFEDVLDP